MRGYTFNPTPQEASLLNQIKANESGGNYGVTISQATCDKLVHPGAICTASGAYQFINQTWQSTASATGVGTDCPTAAMCDPASQDINALYLLRASGTQPWGGAAVYGVSNVPNPSQPLVDVSGDGAATPTTDLMSQVQTQALNVGIDLSNPTTTWIIAGFAAAAVLLFAGRG